MQTPLWQSMCARFMPPVSPQGLLGDLLARFVGNGSRCWYVCCALWRRSRYARSRFQRGAEFPQRVQIATESEVS